MRSEPKLTAIPELPIDIGEYESMLIGTFAGKCPNISGIFNRKPDIWELPSQSGLFKKIKESNFEHISLFNLGGKKHELLPVTKPIELSLDEIQIFNENEVLIQVVTRHLKKNEIMVSTISRNGGDYFCKGGFINLKVQVFNGGADGSAINFKSMTRISLLKNSDLIIYQQIAFPDKVKHIYATYKKKE
jgi:hypothetical protein